MKPDENRSALPGMLNALRGENDKMTHATMIGVPFFGENGF